MMSGRWRWNCLPILIETRRKGIRVDEAQAAKLKKEFKQKESEVLSSIKSQTTLM